ncbi:MAG: undecaprenyl diphosphate synthase family protein, partial [Planctomycetaceae bacterium]|nr:undecaprenyl diphosphate synthase family protein [Planctomycetaceae bacterium]
RISNFLLWQSAYTEFVLLDVLWPDFTPDAFDEALEIFSTRTRRLGGI